MLGQEEHDLADFFLLLPTFPDSLESLGANALHMKKCVRGFLKDVEGAFVINGDDCGSQFRPDAADRTRRQVFLDPLGRRRMRRFEFVGFELLTVLGINEPAACRLNMFTRRN